MHAIGVFGAEGRDLSGTWDRRKGWIYVKGLGFCEDDFLTAQFS